MLKRRSILLFAAALAAGHAGAQTLPAADATVIEAPRPPLPSITVQIAPTPPDENEFPHLPVLLPAVDFWTHVFSDWSEYQSAIHQIDDLSKVYTVLDFRADAAVLSPGALAALRSREEHRAYEMLDATLNELQALQDKGVIEPDRLTPEQRKVYGLYADSEDPKRFKNAVGRFRTQRGLHERTERALQTAGRYLPEMERIFAGYGLPTRLTRLPLVESSFNVEAYSKAAAAGLWQFIPSSARIYMRLNEVVDDRRDPWVSTDAAARHLKDDYDALGNWPLALTAYNYGRGGLARALAEVNGATLTDVIERYNGKRFGFASSNFYAEFLAASDVERNAEHHFTGIVREPLLAFDTVNVEDYVPYQTLRRLSGSDDEEFRRLNPAYRPEVISGRLYVPPGPIRVPQGAAERFRLAYATLSPEQRSPHQRQFYVSHVVARGDSISKLAQRYGVSSQQIIAANGLGKGHAVRVGQTVKIPPRDTNSAPALTAVAVASTTTNAKVKTAVASGQRTHRVAAGQTLGALAKRYQTTIKSLRDLNGFGESDVLRVGSTIKIPNS